MVIQQGARLLTQTAFNLDITARIVGTQSGPVGSPIAIEVQGIGWRELEGSWVLLYDNMFTGFMSVVTTQGTARFTIPATGHEGLHIVEVQHSDFGSPYRNTQQSPVPDRPNFRLDYTITRARRCCRRRLSDKRRRTSAGLRRQAIWLRCPRSRASARPSS